MPSSIPLQQFLSSHSTNLQNTTTSPWTNFLQGSTPFNLNLEVTDLPTGQLAEATLTHFDANGLPIGGTLTLDDDANGLGWFIDETPWENSEFRLPETETLLRATPGSDAYGRYDLLTTILHELGHLAGIIHGNPAYDDRIQYINGSPTFIGNGYSAQLTPDLSHLADPTQLMSPYLAPGVRKLPSQLELQILADIRSALTGRQPTATEISAAETAKPMLGITNGEFDELLAHWQRQGDTIPNSGQAILREDDPPHLNRLRQTFIPTSDSNILSFDLLAPLGNQAKATARACWVTLRSTQPTPVPTQWL